MWYIGKFVVAVMFLFYYNMSGAAAAAVRRFYPTAVAETPGVTYMTRSFAVACEQKILDDTTSASLF